MLIRASSRDFQMDAHRNLFCRDNLLCSPRKPDSELSGRRLWVMLVTLLVGIPLYICATASTPLAASLIAKGMSPSTAFVFLLAGPATNAATITMVAHSLGKR